MMLLLVIFFIGIVYYGSSKSGVGSFVIDRKNSDDLLKEKFVKGEIDESRYLEMKETLNK
jgi:uncharacterized membrane protein